MPFTSAPSTGFLWQNLPEAWADLAPLWVGNYPVTSRVELGAFTGFTLNDPVLGVLDSGVLDGGIAYVDVTSNLIDYGVSRGRSRDLDRTNAGNVGVNLRNEERQFDPLNSASSFQPFTVPRRPVRVLVDGLPVFTGVIDDWNYTYTMGGLSVASIDGSDAFSLFAREENTGGSAVQELSGARINRVLDNTSIPWPTLERDIDDGNTTFAPGILENNVLTYLQQAEESEAGIIFMTKDGKFAFRERLFQPAMNPVTFADTNAGIPYDDIQIVYGTELLTNNVTVTSIAGTATATNATSEVLYGTTGKTVDSLLASGSLQALANYIVARYGEPEYRIERIRVNVRGLSTQQRADVLGLELGSQADVIFTPNQLGIPIAVRNRVIGVSHDVTIDSHYVSLSFEKLPFDFFILDDAVFGKLDDDAGVLGF
jgi:hypothetical protein